MGGGFAHERSKWIFHQRLRLPGPAESARKSGRLAGFENQRAAPRPQFSTLKFLAVRAHSRFHVCIARSGRWLLGGLPGELENQLENLLRKSFPRSLGWQRHQRDDPPCTSPLGSEIKAVAPSKRPKPMGKINMGILAPETSACDAQQPGAAPSPATTTKASADRRLSVMARNRLRCGGTGSAAETHAVSTDIHGGDTNSQQFTQHENKWGRGAGERSQKPNIQMVGTLLLRQILNTRNEL